MYEAEREVARNAVMEACALGRAVQERVVATEDALTKGDRSPVTMADLAIQAVVSRRLAERFPADPLLAEEDSGSLAASPEMSARVLELVQRCDGTMDGNALSAALDRGAHEGDAERYWVLDPVDGTKGFLRGDQYAVALALVHHGKVVVGVLGCPNLAGGAPGARGSLFIAIRGEGTTMYGIDGATGVSVSVDPGDDPAGAVFCESVEAAHSAHSVHARIAELLGTRAEPYRIDSQCKYGIVARGEASIYLRLPRDPKYREKVWDHAAGSLVVEEAGGRVSDLDGDALDFSRGRLLANGRGIIVSNGRFHDRLLDAARTALREA